MHFLRREGEIGIARKRFTDKNASEILSSARIAELRERLERLAIHTDPEPCDGDDNIAAEALTGTHTHLGVPKKQANKAIVPACPAGAVVSQVPASDRPIRLHGLRRDDTIRLDYN